MGKRKEFAPIRKELAPIRKEFAPILSPKSRPDTEKTSSSRPRGYKTFLMLNSTEHEIFPAQIVKLPTVVGILTFMSGKNSILGLSGPKISRIS